ncbi:hypothetical protein SA496_15575 [Pseudomonas sp. JS3066]|uniref:DUF7940 domain-containing protein n=1 Tax=Pseudomonas sp. JS3066 TaxID=3090665 RepID=UPI002E7AE025|nr:hypothetical protein [Pseudomonas sp. JS3066]WVK91148.1 hypothetical protein SA496_15575 [Pseudomonas sp. JS3066]
MQLIDNVSQLFKMTSVQIAGATGLLALAEQLLPQLAGVIPPVAYAVLTGLVIVARAVKQPALAK